MVEACLAAARMALAAALVAALVGSKALVVDNFEIWRQALLFNLLKLLVLNFQRFLMEARCRCFVEMKILPY